MNSAQENILENYKNPKNSGTPDWKPTHSAKLVNLSCGDEIEVFLLVENSVIKDFKFIGIGCSISIAAASLMSEKIIGMNLEEFENYNLENQLQLLGIDLTLTRQKCADLSLQATRNALAGSRL